MLDAIANADAAAKPAHKVGSVDAALRAYASQSGIDRCDYGTRGRSLLRAGELRGGVVAGLDRYSRYHGVDRRSRRADRDGDRRHPAEATVFVGAGEPTFKIERVAPPSSARDGLEVCISGAYGGYRCGRIDKTGRGRTPSGLYRGYDYSLNGRLIKDVYRMRRDSGSCKHGDSGAPVFRLTGTAMGIAFARSRNGQQCIFAQQSRVEYELNVKIYTEDG